jgi:hypothetical protein
MMHSVLLKKIARVRVPQISMFLQVAHPVLKKIATPTHTKNTSINLKLSLQRRTDKIYLPTDSLRVPADAKMPSGACHGH